MIHLTLWNSITTDLYNKVILLFTPPPFENNKEFWVVHTRFYNYLFIYKHSSSSLLSIIFTNVQDIGGLLSLTKMREIDPYKCTNGIPKSCLLEPKLALTLTAWVALRNLFCGRVSLYWNLNRRLTCLFCLPKKRENIERLSTPNISMIPTSNNCKN